MDQNEARLLKAIFDTLEEPDKDYPETAIEKINYAEGTLIDTLQNFSPAIWRLTRLDRLLAVSEKDGKNTLPDIIAYDESRRVIKTLLQIENDIKDVMEILTEFYDGVKPAESSEETK